MARNLSVVSRQEELGEKSCFDHLTYSFYNLLSLVCGGMWADDEWCPSRFECPLCDYERALSTMKAHFEKYKGESIESVNLDDFDSPIQDLFQYGDYSDNEEEAAVIFDGVVKGLGGIEHVIKCMEELYEERDKREGVTRIMFVVTN